MSLATVPVDVPQHVYVRLKNSAAIAKRTVEDVLTSAVSIALPPSPDLPEDLANELAEMIWLSDEALWRVTTPKFTAEQQERLAELNHRVALDELTSEETREQQALLTAYEHIEAVDPDTEVAVRLFHPREHEWTAHFQWSDGGATDWT